MDNLWIIFGKNVRYVCLHTMHDRSLKCCPLRWTHPRTPPRSGLRESWPQTFLPHHATWDDQKNTGEGRFATWRETTIRYVEWWCLCICIYRINYIYIYYICIVMISIGKKFEMFSGRDFLGRLLRNFARLQDGPIVDHGILTRLGHIKIQSLRFWQKVPSSESCGFIFRW